MKKWLNHFLNKKSEFTNDEKLKSSNDQYFFLLGEVKKLSNHIVVENIKYYFEYKKAYLVRLLAVLVVKLAIFVGIIVGGLFSLDYFGVVNISKAIPKAEKRLTVYLPDNDTSNITKIRKTFDVIIFYPPDPKKGWKMFKQSLHNIETKGTSNAASYSQQNGQYWGKYQLGTDARKLVGLEKMSWKEFSTNPDLQEGAILTWMRLMRTIMKPDIDRYNGRYMRGFQITESGIIAMAHNCGEGGARVFLSSNGNSLPEYGNPVLFGKLGGYNLNLE